VLAIALTVAVVQMVPNHNAGGKLHLLAGGAGNALRELFRGYMAEGRKWGVVRHTDFDQVFQKNKLPTLAAAQALVVRHERAVAPAIRPELKCRKVHRH